MKTTKSLTTQYLIITLYAMLLVKGKNSHVTRIATSIILATAAFMIIVASICTFAMFRKKRMLKKTLEECLQTNTYDISIVEPLEYNFDAVSVATNNFSGDNKIGQGGFGSVYQMTTDEPWKRLSRDYGQGEKEFKNEVSLVAKLHHRNLVGLLGFCIEGSERILIYEFMPNSSLDKFLFEFRIGNIARLATYNTLKVWPRDYLPHRSKICLALMKLKETQAGFGYMAPEYVHAWRIPVKLDVLASIVGVRDKLTAKQNQSSRDGNSHVYLLSHIDGSVYSMSTGSYVVKRPPEVTVLVLMVWEGLGTIDFGA
ncbi:putative receptor-like protein kinase [Tanacetum coccineum]|uniref:Receptor-like protein kinase n=1 Tax=Tanacetum coccineum TaxID=301880 RepID=A0ABQ5IX98_9ASTR